MDSIQLGEIFGSMIIPAIIGTYLGWKTLCWFRKEDKKDNKMKEYIEVR